MASANRRWMVAALVPIAMSIVCYLAWPDERTERAAIMAELEHRGLTPGVHTGVTVTAPYSTLVTDTCVVSVMVMASGRLVVFLKTDLGWKGNYRGVVFSNQPIPASDITRDSYGRPQLDAYHFEGPPVIDSLIDSATYRVFFDLG